MEDPQTRNRNDEAETLAAKGSLIVMVIVFAGYLLPLSIAAWRWALQ